MRNGSFSKPLKGRFLTMKHRKRKPKKDFSFVLRQFENCPEVSVVSLLPSSVALEGKSYSPRESKTSENSEVRPERLLYSPAAIFLEQVQREFLRRIRESKGGDSCQS